MLQFHREFERHSYIGVIVIIIVTNLVVSSFRFYNLVFLPEKKAKTRINFSPSWWSGNYNYFCFLFTASHALLQRHAEFNRLLKRNFLTCYSCSYSSFMFYGTEWTTVHQGKNLSMRVNIEGSTGEPTGKIPGTAIGTKFVSLRWHNCGNALDAIVPPSSKKLPFLRGWKNEFILFVLPHENFRFAIEFMLQCVHFVKYKHFYWSCLSNKCW